MQILFFKETIRKRNLNCPTPCHRFSFVPSISFASISANSFSGDKDYRQTQLQNDLVRTREIMRRRDNTVRSSKHLFDATSKELVSSIINLGNIFSEFDRIDSQVQTKLIELHNDCDTTMSIFDKRYDLFKHGFFGAFNVYSQMFMSQVYSPILVLSGQILQREAIGSNDDTDFKKQVLNELAVLNSSLNYGLNSARLQLFSQIAETEMKSDTILQNTIFVITNSDEFSRYLTNSPLSELEGALINVTRAIANQETDAFALFQPLFTEAQSVYRELSRIRVNLFESAEKIMENTRETLNIECSTELRGLYETGFKQYRTPLSELLEAAEYFNSRLEGKSSDFFNGKISFSEIAPDGAFHRQRKILNDNGLQTEAGILKTVTAMRGTSLFIERLIWDLYDSVTIDTFTKDFAYVLGLQWIDTFRLSLHFGGGTGRHLYIYNGTLFEKILTGFPRYDYGFRDDKSARFWSSTIKYVAGNLTTQVKTEISKILNTTGAIVKYFDEYSAETQVDYDFYK